MQELFDTIIIGSGQAGNPLAEALSSSGQKVALIERAFVGGTCINYGCTPTKTMLASAEVASVVKRSADYGVISENVAINMQIVRDRKRKVVESWRSGTQSGIDAAQNLTLVRGNAHFEDDSTVTVGMLDGSSRTLTAKTIVIDAGCRTTVPPISGLDIVPFLDSTSIMELDHVPSHLIVLGGGYVACEFAQMFRSFGSKVTIIERAKRLMSREDEDVSEGLQDVFKDDGIELVLNSTANSVSYSENQVSISYLSDNDFKTVSGSHLMVAVGRTPNTEALNLSSAGIEVDEHGFIKVDDRLQTSAPNVFAVGDVKGGPAFTHISYDDYRVLKRRFVDGDTSASIAGRLVPYTVFTDPQLGRVGLSEEDLKKAGKGYRLAKMPMSRVARAVETGKSSGFMKAVVDKDTDQILGCAILGVDGGEIMAMIEVAMMGKIPYTALRDGIFAHPTLAESLNNLFTNLQ